MLGVVNELRNRGLIAKGSGLTDRCQVDMVGIDERRGASDRINGLRQIEITGCVIGPLGELGRAVIEHAAGCDRLGEGAGLIGRGLSGVDEPSAVLQHVLDAFDAGRGDAPRLHARPSVKGHDRACAATAWANAPLNRAARPSIAK